MSILENAGRSGRMDKEKNWISPTLAKDARRLECFLLFLILANQAGQSPQKSLRDTKFSLFHFFGNFLSYWMFSQGSHSFYFFNKHIFHSFFMRPPRALVDSVLSRYRYLRLYGAGLRWFFQIRKFQNQRVLIVSFNWGCAQIFPYGKNELNTYPKNFIYEYSYLRTKTYRNFFRYVRYIAI